MADDLNDYAKGIAENVGLMPMVMKAGQLGGGFFDFLNSMLGGGKGQPAQTPKPAQAKQAQGSDGGIVDWLRSTGALDAFDQDVERVQRGGLPTGALSDLGKGAMAMQGASFPGYKTADRVFDNTTGWRDVNVQKFPSIDPIRSLAMGGALGPNFSNLLMQLLKYHEKAMEP